MIKHLCDRCGCEVHVMKNLRINALGSAANIIPRENKIELCDSCFESFVRDYLPDAIQHKKQLDKDREERRQELKRKHEEIIRKEQEMKQIQNGYIDVLEDMR